jgi:tyrosyl-tRNA synthetase
MYGKVMSISDDMMWRYYELLTDVRAEQIAAMKSDAACGKAHPMALKKELARSIVADFHSAEGAAKAAEDWTKQFQRGGVPEDVEEVEVYLPDVTAPSAAEFQEALAGETRIKLDRLLAKIRLADSIGDASRKIRQGAVKVDGELKTDPVIFWNVIGEPRTVRVGRKIKSVKLTPSAPNTNLSS